jgi:hypothetical protein
MSSTPRPPVSSPLPGLDGNKGGEIAPRKVSKRPAEPSRAFYPRKRALAACEVCRKRKSKCDNLRPSCGLCQRLNAHCVYRDSSFDHSTLVPPLSNSILLLLMDIGITQATIFRVWKSLNVSIMSPSFLRDMIAEFQPLLHPSMSPSLTSSKRCRPGRSVLLKTVSLATSGSMMQQFFPNLSNSPQGTLAPARTSWNGLSLKALSIAQTPRRSSSTQI